MNKKQFQVNPQDIEEAYKLLGIEPTIIKSEDGDKDDKIGDIDKEGDDEKNKDEDDKTSKAGKSDKKGIEKSENQIKLEAAKKQVEELETLVKAETNPEILKSESPEILKGIQDMNENISKGFKAVGTLVKSLQSELGETKEKLEKAQSDLEELGNQSQGRKSVTTQKFIEKSFQEEGNDGSTNLHVKSNKGQVRNILLEKSGLDTIEKGGKLDPYWSNELTYFESNGFLSKGAIDRLGVDKIKIIQ